MDVEEGVPSTAIREIALLKDLRHANIVDLRDVIYSDSKLYLVFEHLQQDLKKYMDNLVKEGRFMDQDLVRHFLKQLIAGVAFCHDNRVIHRGKAI